MRKVFIFLLFLLIATQAGAAEFLIMARNNWMVDADKTGWSAEQIAEADRQYRIGDIVQVFPDGKLSDYATANGAFYLIRVSGLSYETALKYQEQWNEEYIDKNGETQSRMKQRRIFRVRVADLPTKVKTTLKKTGVFNTTLSAVKNYIRNLKTGVDE